jgi:drug/metabolite transporter (DMT)-like permease
MVLDPPDDPFETCAVELWIPITICAAFMQNLRSSLQKHLKGRLSTSGATFSRFVFAMPFAALYVALLIGGFGYQMPTPNATFLVYMVSGGLGQIIATALLVYIFSFRNFAVGTTFSKTETIQTAIFAVVILGELVSLSAAIGIMISLVGVMMISLKQAPAAVTGWRRWVDRSALIGILSGTFFGISAVSYRAASLALDGGDFVINAAFTLACVTVFQTVVMAVYMQVREPGQVVATLRAWRVAAMVGLSGMLASAGWFTAMTLHNAAYVRALGQVELLFTFAFSYFAFKERYSRAELAGIGLVMLGIVVLLLGR